MMHQYVDRFVQFNRALGKKFAEQENSLRAFANFAAERSIKHVTSTVATEWAAGGSSPLAVQTRFNRVRALAVFLHAEDARHDIPSAGLMGQSPRRRPAPHIIKPDQISRIMQEALQVPSRASISPLTYHNLFGLLSSTGLRISEALSLRCDDLIEDGLMIRNGKFGKSRLVPIHASTRIALERYLEARVALRNTSDDLFVLGHGHAPTRTRAHVVFVRIVRKLGYRKPTGPGPRLHDLRHTFAVRSLEACGNNPQAVLWQMKALSTYLGHAEIANTYWYLEATPVLLKLIASTAEENWIGGAS